MAWQIAVVLDTEYSVLQIEDLAHRMPVWAVETEERLSFAIEIRSKVVDIWKPEPAFTLFTPASKTDPIEICRHILGTIVEHHSQLATLELIGVSESLELIESLRDEGFEPFSRRPREGLSFRKPLERLTDVRNITFDAGRWRTEDDLYNSFFEAVGAPVWHGRNFDALRDSIVFGQINRIEVPYSVAVSMGRCNTGLQFTRRRFKAQGLSRALIEAQSYLVKIGLRVDGQVGLLREVLS
jgi:RNAse (barnase) inhibitor barstar